MLSDPKLLFYVPSFSQLNSSWCYISKQCFQIFTDNILFPTSQNLCHYCGSQDNLESSRFRKYVRPHTFLKKTILSSLQVASHDILQPWQLSLDNDCMTLCLAEIIHLHIGKICTETIIVTETQKTTKEEDNSILLFKYFL